MAEVSRPDDDEPVQMTVNERAVWTALATVVVSSGAYIALMAPRLLSRPVAEISWVGPMLWSIGLSIGGSIVLTVVSTIIAGIGRGGGCSAGRDEVASDVRDREIGQRGVRASMGIISIGFGCALVLAMLDAHTFWIGNLLFVFGAVGAVAEATTKIRLYRHGF